MSAVDVRLDGVATAEPVIVAPPKIERPTLAVLPFSTVEDSAEQRFLARKLGAMDRSECTPISADERLRRLRLR